MHGSIHMRACVIDVFAVPSPNSDSERDNSRTERCPDCPRESAPISTASQFRSRRVSRATTRRRYVPSADQSAQSLPNRASNMRGILPQVLDCDDHQAVSFNRVEQTVHGFSNACSSEGGDPGPRRMSRKCAQQFQFSIQRSQESVTASGCLKARINLIQIRVGT